MLKGVVIGLISSGIIVAVLAAIHTEPVEPWLVLAGLLACLGVAVAVVVGLWRILVRATRWARDELSWRYRQLGGPSRPHHRSSQIGVTRNAPPVRPARPFWQSEAAYEQEQQAAEAMVAQQYMPRASTRMASVRIGERAGVQRPDADSVSSSALPVFPDQAIEGVGMSAESDADGVSDRESLPGERVALAAASGSRGAPAAAASFDRRADLGAFPAGLGDTHGYPLPVETAWAWVRHSSDFMLGMTASRCPGLFEAAFRWRYRMCFGEGLVLPLDASLLGSAEEASVLAPGWSWLRQALVESPDEAALTVTVRQLRDVADLALEDIHAYSQYIAMNPVEAADMDALLRLPEALWPSQVRQCLIHLKDRLHDGRWQTSLNELWRRLRLRSPMTHTGLLDILSVLAGQGVLMKPDVLRGAPMPGPDEPVELFEGDHASGEGAVSSALSEGLLKQGSGQPARQLH